MHLEDIKERSQLDDDSKKKSFTVNERDEDVRQAILAS